MRDADIARIDRDDGLPPMDPDALLAGQPLLVLAPHADDENLALGGLIARALRGAGAHVAVLTDGAASHPGSRLVPPARLAVIRRAEARAALQALGGTARDVTFLDAPDAGLRATPALLGRLVGLARDLGAGLLLAPSPLDPHGDHVAGAALGRALAQSDPGLRLGYYPVWSRWRGRGRAPAPEGTTGHRLDPDPFRSDKAAAIAAHRSQAGLVVLDDPAGFEMPPGFAAFFAGRDEVVFLVDRA